MTRRKRKRWTKTGMAQGQKPKRRSRQPDGIYLDDIKTLNEKGQDYDRAVQLRKEQQQ